MKKFPYIIISFLVAFPLVSFGASTSTISTAQDVINLIVRVGNWMYGAILALAVVFILLSAYNFMGSGGSEEKVTTAKNQLLYTLIAVVVAMLAKGLIALIEKLVVTP